MSRLQQLIGELCPDGVLHKALGDVAKVSKGVQLNRNTLTPSGQFAVMNGGVSPSGFTDTSNTEGQSITISQGGASAGFVSFQPSPFWAGAHCYVVSEKNACLIRKYLFFVLKNKQAELQSSQYGAGIPALSLATLNKVSIPLPPIAVQEEIVRILDTFTALEAELEAELEARKKQYEHYREHLLSVDSCQVPFVSIGDGFHIRNGYTPSKANSENWTNGTVPWFRLEDIRQKGRVLSASMQSIPESAVKGGRKFPANTLLFATSATVGEHALVTVEHLSNQRFTAVWPKEDFAHRFDMKFLFYYGFKIDHWCKENTSTSSFASVDMSGFKKIEIPILPLSEQRVIAKQLDSLDALVNDLNAGLPGELHARRRQYEYYRDKLLTFKEAS